MLTQQLQFNMLHICQYRVCIIYKPGPDPYITDWLWGTTMQKTRDQDMTGMNINVNAIRNGVNMPVCTSLEDIQVATCENVHLQKLKFYIIHGWYTKN